jgi:hypothetical protein
VHVLNAEAEEVARQQEIDDLSPAVGAIARMFSHAGDEAMPVLGWVMRTVDLLARADAA